MNPYYVEQEMHRRVKEYDREAEQYRLARLAQGERKPLVRLDLRRLKCSVQDALAGLGLGLEHCEVRTW